ncbi:hypothetical protein M5689_022764 [Euphorbia peplus]|nr:hypothetical protein M5689_022764 [Euphorbia peplus]
MSCGAFARGANSMFSKAAMRKAYQRKCSSSSDNTLLERTKLDTDEVKKKSINGDNNDWIPDERTGIYYPKGQEKVMEGIPQAAARDFQVNWFSLQQNKDACV